MKKEKRKSYKVLLHRSYIVSVNADNETDAKRLSEFFIGNPAVLINETEKKKFNFNVKNIEMTYNEAPEIL